MKEFFTNHSLKFLSLLCGCVVWFGVVSREESRAEIDLPVKVINLQDNMAMLYPMPPTIPVQLEGRALSLIHLKFSRTAKIEIDLKDMPIGHSRIANERINSVSPNIPDLKMHRIRQTIPLVVDLDAKITQKVPVHSKIHVHAAPGFTFL
ncbi:MAG: hypothetical protein LBB36_00135, partial [Fibromonadaceae bacterium]|nr:hypothetical protein [Fibromonadaceae bacterium]